ncbi:hypothetical protein [Chryseobacterium sp. Mn2064]|uniref:hypothetical protein n=1 Tax=Chryseobacterium sp. Mn2064 TaxID=3395263 RepID=UPI003BE10451
MIISATTVYAAKYRTERVSNGNLIHFFNLIVISNGRNQTMVKIRKTEVHNTASLGYCFTIRKKIIKDITE